MHKAVGKAGYAGQFVSTQGCPEGRCKCVSTCVCVCVHLSPRGPSGCGCRSPACCASWPGDRGREGVWEGEGGGRDGRVCVWWYLVPAYISMCPTLVLLF